MIHPTALPPDWQAEEAAIMRTRRGRKRRPLSCKKTNDLLLETTAMNIVNLSSKVLPPDHLSLLNKGLNFVPTNQSKDFDVKVDMFKFFRSIRLKELDPSIIIRSADKGGVLVILNKKRLCSRMFKTATGQKFQHSFKMWPHPSI